LRLSFLSLALSGLLLLPAAAQADTFNFNAIGSGGGFSGSGVLTASNNGDGSYTINAMSGSSITGLIVADGFFSETIICSFPPLRDCWMSMALLLLRF